MGPASTTASMVSKKQNSKERVSVSDKVPRYKGTTMNSIANILVAELENK